MRFFTIAGLLIAPVLTWGTAIPVANPSFETLPTGGLPFAGLGPGAYSLGTPIPGWNSTSIDNSGQFQPTSIAFNTLDDGPTSAWVRDGNTIFQTVDTPVQAGQEYVLMVDIGYRQDPGYIFAGSADLLINGTRYLATGITPERGFWSTFTATYIGTAADAGSAITIELSANTQSSPPPGPYQVPGSQGNFDNVRLTDPVANPEPALGGVAGIGVLLLIGYQRRKRRVGLNHC